MSELKHFSVMLNECIEGLNLKSDGIYFDGTLGGGGHSYEILKNSVPNGKLIATDLDTYAIERASKKLEEFSGRFTLVKDNFKNFSEIKQNLGIDEFDGIILDLGVSSFQLDDRERGFSYMAKDVLLDMRMDRNNPLTARTIVNEYSERELKRILSEYGHLSNDTCAGVLKTLVNKGTTQFVLAHLSEENNTPHLAYDTSINALLEMGALVNRDYLLKVAEPENTAKPILV
jgi:16S rRNA (cytosine(1402)-N(4))-methyltransferase